MTKLSRFLALSNSEKALFTEAYCWLILAKLLLILLPFKRILPLLKQKNTRERKTIDPNKIKIAITRAASHTPWTSTCLMRSIAARWMLSKRKIPSRISIGMQRKDDGKLQMHAWVTVGEIKIINADDAFSELFCLE